MPNSPYVPGEGPTRCTYMIVGEAPGAQEEAQGRPFVGTSGKLLRHCLDRVGIDENDTYITNVSHYRPPGNDISKFCPRKKRQGVARRYPNELVRQGMYELYEDIAGRKPKVIIPVGNVALWALTGLEEITKRRGSVYQCQFDMERLSHVTSLFGDADQLTDTIKYCMTTKIVPTFHPAFIDRTYSLKPIFEKDLKKAKRETGYPDVRYPERELYIDPDIHMAHELAERMITEYAQFAYDIETPGGNLYCVGFSPDPSWGMVLRTDEKWKRELVRNILESPKPKIAHNGLFDAGFLKYHYELDVRNYTFDTMYAAKLLYPEFRQGLDFLTSFYTDEPYYKDEGKDQDLQSFESELEYLTYNAKDACCTYEVYQEMHKHELKKPWAREAVRHRMALLPLATNAMVRGMQVDPVVQTELRNAVAVEEARAQELVDDAVLNDCVRAAERGDSTALDLAKRVMKNLENDTPGFNVYSTPDMKAYLYDIKKMKVKRHKKTRQPTTEEVALKELYGETLDDTLLQIVNVRKARKLRSNYLARHAAPYGRLVYSLNICATETTRWSSGLTIIITRAAKTKGRRDGVGVNAQTVPLRVREMIVPDPGYVLFNADLAQVEDRIVAYAGNVKRKIHGIENNMDGHSLTASGFFGVSVEEVLAQDKEFKRQGKTPPMRYIGKQSNHAFNYGEQWLTFMRNLNKKADETDIRINAKQSKAIRANHFSMYPEVEDEYWEWIKQQLRTKGRLSNPFGYSRIFYGLRNWPKRDEDVYRQGYAWYPQSTAPEIINRAMVRIHTQFPEAELFLHTHDGIVGQVQERDVDTAREVIMQLMDEPLYVRDHVIHIPVDLQFGESWRAVS